MLTNYIAHLCPLAAGPAIYKARAIYQLIYDTLIYSDSTICRQAGYFRESQELLMPQMQLKDDLINFNIYPNPANDMMQLVFDDVLATKFEIMDLTGNLLFSSSIQGNTIEVSLSNFANGYYLVKAYNSVYGNRVKQLIIVK